jgi:SagB-type dehydrogenase family enzyme
MDSKSIFGNQKLTCTVIAAILSGMVFSVMISSAEDRKMNPLQDHFVINLPSPGQKGRMSLEETLKNRESIRDFSSKPLTKEELSQLLWAVQGTTRDWGARTTPSAGALFPLEVYVVLKEGVFHYSPKDHSLSRNLEQDVRNQLAKTALGQDSVQKAPAVFVIAAVYERTSKKYGNRAERYVKMEAGHAGQNLLLQAVSLGLGAVPVGAFQDDKVKQVLNLPIDHEPLYLIPVGRKR